MDEEEKQIQLNIRVPQSLVLKIRNLAKQLRTTQSWIIRDALHNYVENPSARTAWGTSQAADDQAMDDATSKDAEDPDV